MVDVVARLVGTTFADTFVREVTPITASDFQPAGETEEQQAEEEQKQQQQEEGGDDQEEEGAERRRRLLDAAAAARGAALANGLGFGEFEAEPSPGFRPAAGGGKGGRSANGGVSAMDLTLAEEETGEEQKEEEEEEVVAMKVSRGSSFGAAGQSAAAAHGAAGTTGRAFALPCTKLFILILGYPRPPPPVGDLCGRRRRPRRTVQQGIPGLQASGLSGTLLYALACRCPLASHAAVPLLCLIVPPSPSSPSAAPQRPLPGLHPALHGPAAGARQPAPGRAVPGACA